MCGLPPRLTSSTSYMRASSWPGTRHAIRYDPTRDATNENVVVDPRGRIGDAAPRNADDQLAAPVAVEVEAVVLAVVARDQRDDRRAVLRIDVEELGRIRMRYEQLRPQPSGGALHGKSIQRSVRRQTYSQLTIERGFSYRTATRDSRTLSARNSRTSASVWPVSATSSAMRTRWSCRSTGSGMGGSSIGTGRRSSTPV